jgi:Fe-S-cluster containining protein
MSDLKVLSDVWYKEGLRFKCTGCGKCCTGAPGYVWLDEEDIERLAMKLNLSKETFLKTYTRQVGSRISLCEDPQNYDCTFLKEGKFCSVYQDRPKQCQTFPFWKEVLSSAQEWNETKALCEGIESEDAPLIPLEEIQKQLK